MLTVMSLVPTLTLKLDCWVLVELKVFDAFGGLF